ncbi:MAG: cobalamin-dependent protein [Deltaproteobacteria bacterium]|nr:cobalamin-dependent protein [Deltaproteobacteria bacterium]
MTVDISQVFESYYSAVFDTDRDGALDVVETAMRDGMTAETIVFDVVLPSMDKMLHAISQDDSATLSQHFLAAKVAGELVEGPLPRLKKTSTQCGTVVVGTAAGDFHGLGKRIVTGCLVANMFTVHDAGLNVSPVQFVDLAEETGAAIIGVSSMMMHTTVAENGPKGVRRELARRSLEPRIKLIVDGAPYRFDAALYRKVDADGFALSGLEAVGLVRALTAMGEYHA